MYTHSILLKLVTDIEGSLNYLQFLERGYL